MYHIWYHVCTIYGTIYRPYMIHIWGMWFIKFELVPVHLFLLPWYRVFSSAHIYIYIYWLRPGRPNLKFCCCGFSRFWFSCFVVLSGLISILFSVCFWVLLGGLGLVLNALECSGPGYSCFWCSLAWFGQLASKTSFFKTFWGTLETLLLDEGFNLMLGC